VKAEFRRLYPQEQELLDEDEPDGAELGAWEGPEGDGSTSRWVRVWIKEMELQRHYSDDSRAEDEKEKLFLSGFVYPGFTFSYSYDVRKIADFSVGKRNCLAAHHFALVGRHEPHVDNMRMEAAIPKYGGKVVSADDFPLKSFPILACGHLIGR
jgi:hypothetical protein